MTIKRDPETEEFIKTLENSEIYFFMREEFDRITNDGDNYDPEVDDQQVIKATAEKFSISESDADTIYTSTEFAIADFLTKRYK
jgi:hypothetical protein